MKEISIEEFARRSRRSLKALRLYDERGVPVPSRVDQASGYRYYDPALSFSIRGPSLILDVVKDRRQ